MPSVDRQVVLAEYSGLRPNVAEQVRANLARIIISHSITHEWGPSVRIAKSLIASTHSDSEGMLSNYHFRFHQGNQLYAGMGDSLNPLPVGTVIDSVARRKERSRILHDEDAIVFPADELSQMVFEGMGIQSKNQKRFQLQDSSESTGAKGRRGLPFHAGGLKRQIVENMKDLRIQEAQKRKREEEALQNAPADPTIHSTDPKDTKEKDERKSRVKIAHPELANLRKTPVTAEKKIKPVELLELAVPVIILDARTFRLGDFSLGLSDNHKDIVHDNVVWHLRFLRTKYKRVEPIFIVHAAESQEVSSLDEALSYQPPGSTYGPQCLGYLRALQSLTDHHINPDNADIYPLDFSTGSVRDGEDQVSSVIGVDKLRSISSRTAITILGNEISHSSSLEHSLIEVGAIALPKVVVARISEREGVLPLLRIQLPEKPDEDIFQQESKIAR